MHCMMQRTTEKEYGSSIPCEIQGSLKSKPQEIGNFLRLVSFPRLIPAAGLLFFSAVVKLFSNFSSKDVICYLLLISL